MIIIVYAYNKEFIFTLVSAVDFIWLMAPAMHTFTNALRTDE